MNGMFEIGKLPSLREADRLIQDVPREEFLLHQWGNTRNIMDGIMRLVNNDAYNDADLTEQVRDFAMRYYAEDWQVQIRNLRQMHSDIRRRIKYIKDPSGDQFLKHPTRTWKDGYGDCKALSIILYHCLKVLGIHSFIRFASYVPSGQIGHVYNVALLNGQLVPIDLCLPSFGVEEKATKTKDKYSVDYPSQVIQQAARQQRNAALNGIGQTQRPNWVNAALVILNGVGLVQSKNIFIKGINGAMGLYFANEFVHNLQSIKQ